MQTLNLDLGEIQLAINGDESRVVRFNPRDIGFAERFYNLLGIFEQKQKEYTKKLEVLEADKKTDKHGIPKNSAEYIALLREVCAGMRDDVDEVFGAGTSQAAFGDAMIIDMFAQLFEGVTPFIQKARDERTAKYTDRPKALK